MTPEQMRRAAAVLEREADAIWHCHSYDGHWVLHDEADIAARADHNEMTDLARLLREQAEAMERTSKPHDEIHADSLRRDGEVWVSPWGKFRWSHEAGKWFVLPPPPEGGK